MSVVIGAGCNDVSNKDCEHVLRYYMIDVLLLDCVIGDKVLMLALECVIH